MRCTCGNEFVTRSTKGDIHVEICSNCHPFYTGKQKLVDTGGRVERFQRKLAKQRARIVGRVSCASERLCVIGSLEHAVMQLTRAPAAS